MKFVCQNCKAKYQIADEKVAGRNLKMKCRKCDAIIPISGAGISAGMGEPSASDQTAAQKTQQEAPSKLRAVAPPPRSSPSGAQPAVRPAPSSTGRLAAAKTAVGSSPVGSSPVAAPVGTAKATAPGRAASPSQSHLPRATARRSAQTSVAAAPASSPRSSSVPQAPPERKSDPSPRAAAKEIPASAKRGRELSIPTPRTPQPVPTPRTPQPVPTSRASQPGQAPPSSRPAKSAPSVEDRWSSLPPGGVGRESSPPQTDAPGALAGAFQAAVARTDAAPSAKGPIGSSPSLIEASGPAASEPPAADEWFVGIAGVPTGPLRLGELRAKAMGGLIHADSLVWRDGFENWLPLHKFPELVAIVEEGMSSARASAAPLVAPVEQADPFAPDAAPRAAAHLGPTRAVAPPTTAAANVEIDESVVLGRPSRFSPAALFAMVVAVAFGLTIGFVLFGGEKTKVIREVVEVPVAAQQEVQPQQEPTEELEAEEAGDETEVSTKPASSKPASGSTKVAVASKPATAPSNEGLSGLSGLKGVAAGPQSGPGNGPSGSSGQPLDSSQVQSTVSRYTTSVRRSCWQPALDTRDPNAPASARVSVAITVGPDGRVRNATTTSDPKGYPGLANCITQRVRTWTFPPSSGTTTVNVPFVFAAQ